MKLEKASEKFHQFMQVVQSKFPHDFFSQDPHDLKNYGKDWTKAYTPNPSAVVFPRSTQEVAAFLKLCSQYQIPVVPSGGRTGLAAGAVAAEGEVVLSLSRMNQIGPVDPLSHTLRVQAGAVTEAIHQKCASYGLTWPVDFASKGSSQVGGNIATNAGGLKVIRYGHTRNWVLGLQVVTMQGEVLELNGALEKNNTGLDLRQLFIGSEGTLGVITEATLKLMRLPGPLEVCFFAVQSVSAVLRLFEEARKAPFQIAAFEFLTENCLKLVTDVRQISAPFQSSYPAYVLLELERPESLQAQESLQAWLEGLFSRGLVQEGTLAQSPREAKELWSLREGISESLSVRGVVHKNDIALPIAQLEPFIKEMYQLYQKQSESFEVFLFGHIGDGNLHVNTMKPQDLDSSIFFEKCKHADFELFSLVKKYQGSVSAEHGVGLIKKSYLEFTRSPEEIAVMRGIKKVLDPQGLLNPGKIFD